MSSAPPTDPINPQAPPRRLGLIEAAALNMATMIGVGPFITIPLLMTAMHGPQAMLGWVVGLLLASADGLIWSELGAALPSSGGSYVYLWEAFGRQTMGKAMAFLFIWQFILSGPLEIASGYIGLAQYARYLWPDLSPGATSCLEIGAGLLVLALLYRKINAVGRLTVGLWVVSLITVAAVLVSGPMQFKASRAFDFPPGAFHLSLDFWLSLGMAASIGVYDYLGYYNVCYLGDEVREPGRVIPRSILISLGVVAVLYLAMNLSIIGVVPWREFVPAPGHALPDPPPPIASMFMEKIYGRSVAAGFTILVLITALASCFGLVLGYSRIPYAAARDGNFFAVFGRLHPRLGFPHVSLLLVGLLSVIASLLPLATVLTALLGTRILIQFIGQIGALVWLRRKRPELVRPFRVWFYPVPPILALVGWLFLFLTNDTATIVYSLAVLALGCVSFLGWSAWRGQWPFRSRAGSEE